MNCRPSPTLQSKLARANAMVLSLDVAVNGSGNFFFAVSCSSDDATVATIDADETTIVIGCKAVAGSDTNFAMLVGGAGAVLADGHAALA